jgi:prepilin-type N-terminal cleavage/methylation domain-containing protein
MIMRSRRPRGFSLIEAMVALAASAVVTTTAITIFKTTIDEQSKASHEWSAFTIAEQRMELLANAPRNSSLLDDTVADASGVTPGSVADQQCTSGVDGKLTADMKVDMLGVASSNGSFELCWKMTAGSPSGSLRNVRVIVTYPKGNGTRGYVFLQTFR